MINNNNNNNNNEKETMAQTFFYEDGPKSFKDKVPYKGSKAFLLKGL